MHDQPEWAYHLARYAQCQRMGLLASDEVIRHLHLQLADKHAERARSAFRFQAVEESGLVLCY